MFHTHHDCMDRECKKMKERVALECILDISDSLYHKTGDKWYLSLGIGVATKLRSKNNGTKNL